MVIPCWTVVLHASHVTKNLVWTRSILSLPTRSIFHFLPCRYTRFGCEQVVSERPFTLVSVGSLTPSRGTAPMCRVGVMKAVGVLIVIIHPHLLKQCLPTVRLVLSCYSYCALNSGPQPLVFVKNLVRNDGHSEKCWESQASSVTLGGQCINLICQTHSRSREESAV